MSEMRTEAHAESPAQGAGPRAGRVDRLLLAGGAAPVRAGAIAHPDGRRRRRQWAFTLLCCYVGAGLGLLVTTSFLGLRRYLRQRGVEMPDDMAAVWIGLGAAMIVVLLFLVALLPRPAAEYPISQFPLTFTTPERESSRWAVGNDGADKNDPDSQSRVTDEDEQDESAGPETRKNTDSREASDEGESGEGKAKDSGESSSEKSDSAKQKPSDQSQQREQGDQRKEPSDRSDQDDRGEKSESPSDDKSESGERRDRDSQKGEKSEEQEEREQGQRDTDDPESKDDEQQSDSSESQPRDKETSDDQQRRDQDENIARSRRKPIEVVEQAVAATEQAFAAVAARQYVARRDIQADHLRVAAGRRRLCVVEIARPRVGRDRAVSARAARLLGKSVRREKSIGGRGRGRGVEENAAAALLGLSRSVYFGAGRATSARADCPLHVRGVGGLGARAGMSAGGGPDASRVRATSARPVRVAFRGSEPVGRSLLAGGVRPGASGRAEYRAAGAALAGNEGDSATAGHSRRPIVRLTCRLLQLNSCLASEHPGGPSDN